MNLSSLVPVLVVGVLLFVFVLKPLFFGAPRIAAGEAEMKVKAGAAILVDVREPAEWLSGVAKPAILLPMSDFQGARKQWSPVLEKHRHQLIIVYCASGIRSGSVASRLAKEGFQAANLGGFGNWRSAGLSVRTP